MTTQEETETPPVVVLLRSKLKQLQKESIKADEEISTAAAHVVWGGEEQAKRQAQIESVADAIIHLMTEPDGRIPGTWDANYVEPASDPGGDEVGIGFTEEVTQFQNFGGKFYLRREDAPDHFEQKSWFMVYRIIKKLRQHAGRFSCVEINFKVTYRSDAEPL